MQVGNKTMEIRTKIENGKAYLEFAMQTEQSMLLQIYDRDGREVFRCIHPLSEEEPARAILLHPHLWDGIEDPYQYHLKAYFLNQTGEIGESMEQTFALYSFEEIPGKGLFLNGKPFVMRAVQWDGGKEKAEEGKVEESGAEAVDGELATESDRQILMQLGRMGANTVWLSKTKASKDFLQLCREMGFLVVEQVEKETRVADCRELFLSQAPFFTDTYYRYKAKWSRVPFLYISMDSIQKNEKGTLSLRVYSNQKKIALYVEGVLFEFLTGEQEFFFEEIPVKKYPVVLTAEAGECSTTVMVYEHSQKSHVNNTFS